MNRPSLDRPLPPLAGIFVGGRARRMGGAAKGLLVAPDGEPIVERTRRILERAGASCVLVGEHAAYRSLAIPTIADDPSASGPLAGLLTLLSHGARSAHAHPAAHGARAYVLAVGCDMPFLTEEIVRRLVDAPDASIVSARRLHADRGWLWEPLFARYAAADVLPVAQAFAASGRRRLQELLDEARAAALDLASDEATLLDDWDSPDDLPPEARHGTRGQ